MFRAKSVVVLLLLVARVACVEEIPAYRLLQYDAVSEVIQSDGEDLDEPERVSLTRIPFGATQSGFSLLAAPVFPHEDGFRDRSHMLVKNVALVRLQDVNMSRLESWVDGRRAGAVLILLPSIPANIQVYVLSSVAGLLCLNHTRFVRCAGDFHS